MFSPLWYRAANLKPKWRLHVRADRQVSRQQVWYVFSNSAGARSSRIDSAAYALIGRCDGQVTLEEIWQALLKKDAEQAPTQDQVLSTMTQLVGDGFLECESWPDIGQLIHNDEVAATAKRSAKLNPLSIRVPLGNPSRLLRRHTRWAHRLFSYGGLTVWLVLLLAAGLVCVGNFDELSTHAQTWLNTPRYWLLAWFCFVPVKLIHEWAHALAVRRFGGQVKEVGIGILMLFPAPYVDASEANRFSSSRARALVSAAGILAELAMAAIGVLIWYSSEPGWLRDIAFTVAFIGGVSTLMFNANPLMRMDGYFVLSDWAQLPNLSTRSASHWQNVLQQSLLGVAATRPVQTAVGERKWLLAYAPAALAYRLAISLWLVLWIGEFNRWLGILTGLLMIFWIAIVPLNRLLVNARQSAQSYRQRLLAPSRLLLAIGLLALLGAVVPFPDQRIAEGVVWTDEHNQLRAPIEGFVAAKQIRNTSSVRRDELVLLLEDPVLNAERQRLIQRRPGLQSELYASLRTDPARSSMVQEQLGSLEASLARIDERIAQLQIQAGSDGELSITTPQDLPGRFVKQGEVVGVIKTRRAPIIRVALDQDEAARVTSESKGVSVRLAELPGQALAAHLHRQQPAAATKLPSAALAEVNGGSIQIDPKDKDGTKPAYPTFLIDVELANESGASRHAALGGRAQVKFEFGYAPLWSQLARTMRQTIRTRFAAEQV